MRGAQMKIVASLVLVLIASLAWAEPIEHQVTVKGEGKVRVPPDYVAIEIGISGTGQDIERLKQEVDLKTLRLVEVASKFKIAAVDVKSGGVRVSKIFDTDRNENDVFKGYEVSRSLELRLRQFAEYEKFAQALVSAGMNEIESLTVGVDDESKLRNPALAAAAKDARLKAQAVAESLGIRIGLPIEVGEDRLWYDKRLVQIAPGDELGEIVVTGSGVRTLPALPLLFTPRDVEVQAQVWVRFAIETTK